MTPKEIKKRLIDLDWTQDDLAAGTGIDKTSISKLLRGRLPFSDGTRKKILKALHKREMARVAA